MGNHHSSGGARRQMEAMRSQMAQMQRQRAADNAAAEKRLQDQQKRAEDELKRTEALYKEQQRLEREKNEIAMQMANLASKEAIYKAKQDALTTIKEELSKVNQECAKQEAKLNEILSEINIQSKNISRKWLNMDCDHIDNDSNENKSSECDYNVITVNDMDSSVDSMETPATDEGNHNSNNNNNNDNNSTNDDTKECEFENNNNNNNNNNNSGNYEGQAASKYVLKQIELLQSKLSKMRVLICIGKTGFGKSTFLNRLIGDTSDDGDQGNGNIIFKVGKHVDSETSEVNHKFIKHNFDNRYYCIVDTPGSSDSYGRDNDHTNNIGEYLCGCGGINAFLIFVNLADAKIDHDYIKLLKLYRNMLDDNNGLWWKHVIIIGTNYDTYLHKERNTLKRMNQTDRDDYLNARANEIINKFKSKKELGIPRNLPMTLVPIGHDNYEEAIEHALSQVQGYKFVCNKIVSPLNQLKEDARNEENLLNEKKFEVNKIQIRKERIESEIESVLKQIDDINKNIEGRSQASQAS